MRNYLLLFPPVYAIISKKESFVMKALKKFNLIFIILSVVILIACVLPVILSGDAAITFASAPAIVFGVCSAVYAVIAFMNKQKSNLFVLGRNKLFIAFLRSLSDNNVNTDSDEYKKEFAFSAFIYCASIPFYIPLAFFAKEYYSALSSTLLVTLLRLFCMLALVLIPPMIKNAKAKKHERIKDEADRKEQEHRESMGKWK